MAKAAARPLSTAEAVLAATFAYLVLLISLTGARIAGEGSTGGAPEAAAARPVTQLRLAALTGRGPAARPPAADPASEAGSAAAGAGTAGSGTAGSGGRAPAPTCVGAGTVPYSHAAAPGVVEPLAFGPPVEPTGPRSAAAINGVLIQRLCGGPATPGGPVLAPDRRLFAAIDAAVNGRDPNRPLTRAQWAAGVDSFVIRDGLFVDARVVTRTVRTGTRTLGMKVVSRTPGTDPVVVRTRLARADTSRYLLLPVRSASGRVVTLTLRLRCGFQPVL
ncbi:MAG TPA: hypothetical protein VE547_08220 [Mycobacteriales bacterium]|jgi:hypothetical protein|nr:hypothetical protein [Mycobacteriales bacterium]